MELVRGLNETRKYAPRPFHSPNLINYPESFTPGGHFDIQHDVLSSSASQSTIAKKWEVAPKNMRLGPPPVIQLEDREQLPGLTDACNNQPSHPGHQLSRPRPAIVLTAPWWRTRAAFVVATATKWALPGRGLGAARDETAGFARRVVIRLADESYRATVLP